MRPWAEMRGGRLRVHQLRREGQRRLHLLRHVPVRLRPGVRDWPALLLRSLRVRRDVVQRLLRQWGHMPHGLRGRRVRRGGSALLGLRRRNVHGRGLLGVRDQLRGGLLLGDGVQVLRANDVRRRRLGLRGLRRHTLRRMLHDRSVHVRRRPRLRGGASVRGRALHLRRSFLPGRVLRRNRVRARHLPLGVRSCWRHLQSMRIRYGRRLHQRRVHLRHGRSLRRWTGLPQRSLSLQRDVVRERLLRSRRDVCVADVHRVRQLGDELHCLRRRALGQLQRRRLLLVRRRRGVRLGATLPRRQVRVRRDRLPDGLLRCGDVPARQPDDRVRDGREHLRLVSHGPDVHRGWALLGLRRYVHDRVLHGADVQPAIARGMRHGRWGVQRVQRHDR